MAEQHIEVKPLTDLEKELQYEFKNKDLIRQALTHKSAINEKHPMAFHCDYGPLAFLGDAALKYAVARYLIQNGQEDVITNPAKLNKGTQTIVPNVVLAEIAREKLCLEKYLTRGKGLSKISEGMYASCFEAILGAIALDCGVDQQEVIFCLIERLCSDRYKTFLKPLNLWTFKAVYDDDEEEEEIYLVKASLFDCMRQRAASSAQSYRIIVETREKNRLQKLGFVILWFFAMCGILLIIWHFLPFIQSYWWNNNVYQHGEF
ncbi:unnamed protein product [Adineta ricciae]|uniref:RNase III domain-containing protein n=1 Tax=Adineta ricciae TaxID=249248 RepID=A0A815V4Z1_ADIRI|nr:unnamed protein product [Adineta ricciae]CAF1656210.1 unnamed protein product [Adineta ricciae]